MSSRTDMVDGVRARAPLLGAAALVAAVLTASARAWRPGDPGRPLWFGWNLLGVRSAMSPAFADLRNVTHRWACVRAGIDSYRDGRCDPWTRLFNYPPPWLWPARLGWGAELTLPLACVEVGLFFAALWALFPARDAPQGLAIALLVLTPPVMFAVERGNVDMLMFAGLVGAFVASRRAPERIRGAVRLTSLTLLAFLKLYPLAGFVYAARTPRRAALTIAAMAAIALAIWSAYRPVLSLMALNSGEAVDDSYGRLVRFALAGPGDVATAALRRWSLATASVLIAAGAGAGLVFARRITAALGSLLDTELTSQLAGCGAAIYVCTWLIGSSYDYRLIYLLLLFPLLFAQDGGRWRSPALAVGLLMFARLALAHRVPYAWAADYDFALVPLLTAWGAASARLRWSASAAA